MLRAVLLPLLGAVVLWTAAPPACANDAAEAEPVLQAIRQLQDSGEVEAAARKARELISSHPDLLRAHVAHQDVELALGRADALIEEYAPRARAEGAHADDIYLHARLLTGTAAVSAYRSALKRDPAHFWSLCGLGAELTAVGKLRPATVALEQAREVDPTAGAPVNLLGRVAELQGKTPQAEAFYREAVKLSPEHVIAHVNLGVLLVGIGRFDDAIETLDAAVDLAPRSTTAWLGLGMARSAAGHGEAAIAAFQNATAFDADSVLALNLLANAYIHLDRHDEAKTAILSALQIDGDHAPSHVFLAYVHLAKGDLVLARGSADKALDLDANLAEARYMQGICEEREGRTKKAETHYKRAARMEPQDPMYVRALAILYEGEGRWKEAVRERQKVVKLTDGAPRACFDLALAHWSNGKHDKAAGSFEDVVAIDNDDRDAWLNLGILYHQQLRKKRKARFAYQRYLDLGGTDDRVAGWLNDLDGR